jgi:hypothetical protein
MACGECQRSAKADCLDSHAPIFVVGDPASLKPCVGGFVYDNRSDHLCARFRVCEESVVEHTGFERMIVFGASTVSDTFQREVSVHPDCVQRPSH